jgi:hypothetical protein
MTAHLQSICRSSWRLFVLWVATAAWAGFCFIEPQNISILAFSTEAPYSADGCFGIMSRAALLLRVSAGATAELIRDVGFSDDTFSFWWKQLGKATGLWSHDQELPLIDLWADVKPSLDEFVAFENDRPDADQTFFLAAEQIGTAFVTLSGCERIALWSLPPEA